MPEFVPVDLTKPQGVSILLFGETGTGKTRLLTTHKDIVILGTEGRPLTVAQQAWLVENEVSYAIAESVEAIVSGMKYCRNKRRSCGIDSISFWQSEHQVKLVDESGKGKLDFDGWGDVLISTVRSLKFISDIKAAGMDVIVTAHIYTGIPKRLKNEYSGEYSKKVARLASLRPSERAAAEERLFAEYSIVMPHLSGQMRDRIGHWFDAVGLCERKGDVYRVLFNCDYADTKDSGGLLGNIEIQENDSLALQKICDTIRGKSLDIQ